MDNQEIAQSFFGPLFSGMDDLDILITEKPFLAHYTSIEVLEKIVSKDEVWLSNPLFMNDLEEVIFGINEGLKVFSQSPHIANASGSPQRAEIIKNALGHYYLQFEKEHVFDTYIFCLAEHDAENADGLLSMWRGYGSRGNGAALVFNTGLTTRNEASPLLMTKVTYATGQQRIQWLIDKLNQWCAILQSLAVPDDKLHLAAHALFELIKFYALKSKHHGFAEEREWRVIYAPWRDPLGRYKDKFKFHYLIGKQGVEPKLVFKIGPIDDSVSWTFNDILHQIILGPSLSSELARRSVQRMFEVLGKPEFAAKVAASQIPLRPGS